MLPHSTSSSVQCRNKKLKQFSNERDIVSEIQISEGALAKRNPNSNFQQLIHAYACGKRSRGQHTALANTGLNLQLTRVVIQHSEQSHYLVWNTKPRQE